MSAVDYLSWMSYITGRLAAIDNEKAAQYLRLQYQYKLSIHESQNPTTKTFIYFNTFQNRSTAYLSGSNITYSALTMSYSNLMPYILLEDFKNLTSLSSGFYEVLKSLVSPHGFMSAQAETPLFSTSKSYKYRGLISLPQNYLILGHLYNYRLQLRNSSQYYTLVHELVQNTMLKNGLSKGVIYEFYDPVTGQGRFQETAASESTFLLILGEKYL